jgi:hypothetical protein
MSGTAGRWVPHHASWDIRAASNLWHGIRNERQAKAAWQKRSAVKHYLSHDRYNPSPTVKLATQDALRSLSAGSTSSRLWSARRQRQDRSVSGRGSRSGRIGPVPYCTGGGGSWHAEGASCGRTDPQERTPRSGSLRPARPRYGRRSSGSDIMQGTGELLGKGKCAAPKNELTNRKKMLLSDSLRPKWKLLGAPVRTLSA